MKKIKIPNNTKLHIERNGAWNKAYNLIYGDVYISVIFHDQHELVCGNRIHNMHVWYHYNYDSPSLIPLHNQISDIVKDKNGNLCAYKLGNVFNYYNIHRLKCNGLQI